MVAFPQPVLHILHHPSVYGQQVSHKGHEHGLETDSQEDRGQNQGLYHTLTLASQVVVKEAQSNEEAQSKKGKAYGHEKPKWLVDCENTHNGKH